MTQSRPSLSDDAEQTTRKRRQILLVLTVALCLLISREAWVGAESRSEHDHQEAGKLRTVEGKVTNVDAGAGTIEISWGQFGVFGKTLEVRAETRIRLVGRPATLEDIREGATIRAGYQSASGRSIAKTVDMVLAPIVSAGRPP